MTDKMREEFEAAIVAEFVADLESKADFPDGMAETVVRATILGRDEAGEYIAVVPRERFKGWVQGRASFVVELPAIDDPDCGQRVSFHLGAYKTQCRQAIKAAGGTVKP